MDTNNTDLNCPTVGQLDNFNYQYNAYRELAKTAIAKYLDGADANNPVLESMRYTLSTEGKLFRPVFCLAIADYLNLDLELVSKLSLLLELIHVSSLIHDDLPALDNDDYRRGKLSCHKVFGEGRSILLGDYLISEAYKIIPKHLKDGNKVAKLFMALSSAFSDLCIGQVLDLDLRGKALNQEEAIKELERINALKTGALFELSAEIPLILSDLSRDEANTIKEYSRKLGLLFQLSDDILDVNSDAKCEKDKEINYIDVLGYEATEARAEALVQSTIETLNSLHDKGSSFMRECVHFARGRKD